MSTRGWLTERHRTAIGRSSLSMPAKQALFDGIIRSEWTVLDYGSGRGGDVARLAHLGILATGWDPHHGGIRREEPRDIVTLTYVVNVTALFVLSRIALRKTDDGTVEATGGDPHVLDPWQIDEGRLTPIGFRYQPSNRQTGG